MLQTCADGYFLSGSSCQKCSSLCQNCEAESTICTSCPPGGYILDNSRCKTQNQIRDEAIPTFRLILLLSIFSYIAIFVTAQLLICWDDYRYSGYNYK